MKAATKVTFNGDWLLKLLREVKNQWWCMSYVPGVPTAPLVMQPLDEPSICRTVHVICPMEISE